MPGKYDFPGIKKAGIAAASVILASTGWGAKILASPFKNLFEYLIGYVVEWAANKGLVIINISAIYINGEIDQKRFDDAFDKALETVKIPGLTDVEKEKIDNEIIKAFRNFARLNSKPSSP